MRALVVAAHPVPESFNGAVRARAVDAITAAGHEVDLLDLYRSTAAEVDIERADALVLVYPTWWGGLPAALKHWLDTQWPEPIGVRPSRTHPGIGRLAVVTTHGSGRLRNMAQGSPGRRLVSRGLRSCCGPRTRLDWVAMYDLDRSTEAERGAFLDRVTRSFAAW